MRDYSFYLAGRVSRGPELIQYRTQLEALGYHVTSSWLDHLEDNGGRHANRSLMHAEERADIARRDLHDIRRAEGVVLFSEAANNTSNGGRLVEFGYAMGRNKDLYVVGPLENLFLCMGKVTRFAEWKEMYDWLKADPGPRPRYEEPAATSRDVHQGGTAGGDAPPAGAL